MDHATLLFTSGRDLVFGTEPFAPEDLLSLSPYLPRQLTTDN